MMMQVYYCDHFELPLPEGHRFPIQKYQRTREKVASRLGDHVRLRVAPRISREHLLMVHAEEYVSRVFDGALSELEQKRIGFPWSPKMLERSRRSAGATLEAARSALSDGIAVHLSGGTHHAFADHGQGFCVFNDIAVAIRVLQHEQVNSNALVVDLDVHQGNGTAAIFNGDPSVFTFSIHGDRNFPFEKREGDLDIALPDGVDDDAYLEILCDALHKVGCSRADEAGKVFYIAGADPHESDRMGRLKLSIEGLARRDALVLEHFTRKRMPITIVMGGGYGDIETVSDIHAQTVEVALQYCPMFGKSERFSKRL